MEGSQPLRTLNQQLNSFVTQMESEIGRTCKTLHQVSSEYLILKTENHSLAQKLENLDIPDAETFTPELFQEQCELLHRFQFLKDKIFQALENPQEHPWQPFAHPDHRTDEYELLLRTIRFVSIQLNKFWVEVQSFPLFLNTIETVSIHELDQIFQWLKNSKPWNELILQPRVIPALIQSSSRKALFEFVRDVKSIRALLEKANKFQSSSKLTSSQLLSSPAILTEALELISKLRVATCNSIDLEVKINHAKKQLNQLRQVQQFFADLSMKTSIPQPTHPQEALLIFKAKDSFAKIPKKILPWRLPQILAPQQNIRIQGLQDRARPILEAKKRIENHFNISQTVDPEELRQLAAALTSGGVFKTFKAPYQAALSQYRNLLCETADRKSQLKESPLQMSERLIEWANFIEQSQSFDKNSDIAKTFGSFFKGIQTDFATALEANLWATQLRNELGGSQSPFADLVMQYIFKATEENLNELVNSLKTEEAQVLQGLLERSEIGDETTFSELGSIVHHQLSGYEKILNTASVLDLYPEVPFSSLEELRQLHEEIAFLLSQVESNTESKNILKNFYLGAETDLGLIENSLAYLEFIDHASIPGELKASLLSVHGPQRFGETRTFASQILGSLAGIKELFQKLEVVTRGQAQSLIQYPVPKLLTQCQQALKQSNLLDEWIDYLKCEREAKVRGLGSVLEFYENNTIEGKDFVNAFRIAFYATLLKKTISQSVVTKDRGTLPLVFH